MTNYAWYSEQQEEQLLARNRMRLQVHRTVDGKEVLCTHVGEACEWPDAVNLGELQCGQYGSFVRYGRAAWRG